MPTPAASVFRSGSWSHPGRRSRPGRRGNRSRTRDDFARRCATSREAVSSSASPVSAAIRSFETRARAALARASALATSSSAPMSETGVTTTAATPERGCGAPGSITFAGPQWSASGPSGSCTENELITSVWRRRFHRAAAIVALTCGNARPPENEAEWIKVARRRRLFDQGDLLRTGEFPFQFFSGVAK